MVIIDEILPRLECCNVDYEYLMRRHMLKRAPYNLVTIFSFTLL